MRSAVPTPSRFAPPTLAPGPKSIGTQRRPRSRGGVSVGRYWGRSLVTRRTACRWNGDGWVRCPTTGSYPHPLRQPVCQSRSAYAGAVPRVQGGRLSYVWYFRIPHLPREFPHAPPGGGDMSFVFLLLLVPGSLLLPLVARLLPPLLLCSGHV